MRALLVRLAAVLLTLLVPAAAMADTGDVQTAWRLLDNMAVDYGGAVANGAVKSASEYAEMNEFAAGSASASRSSIASPRPRSKERTRAMSASKARCCA